MKQLKIKLIYSTIGSKPVHRKNVEALGLKKIGQEVLRQDTPIIRGIIANAPIYSVLKNWTRRIGMKLYELKPAPGSKKGRRRVGRGQGSGHGKASGRGHDGQNSRSGGGVRIGFEGGQLPIYRRLPKRGFSNERFETRYAIVNLSQLENLEESTITPELLLEKGVIKKILDGLKILGEGEISRAMDIHAHKFSASAVEKIEKAGGKVEVI